MARPSPLAYRAFMSYSHATDARLAPALQSALQNFAKPWYRMRGIHVFRDQTSLSANPALWPAIERALQDSEWFLLIASVESATSRWVGQEVHWWLEHRSPDTMLIVLSDGELVWEQSRSDFDWGKTTALGRYLAGRLAREPLYVDLRWAKSIDNLSLRHTRFRAAVLDLAAPLCGRPKDELDGDDVRQHRRTRRVAWAAGIALAGLTVAAVLAAGVAVRQAQIAERRREEAERERRIAVSRQLAAQAEILRAQRTDLLHTSLLLAVESLRHAFSLEAVQSLQKGLQLLPERGSVAVQHSDIVNDALLTPDNRLLITASDDGTACVWDAATGVQQAKLEVTGRVMELHLTRDGSRLATMAFQGKTVRVWQLATGKEIGRFEHPQPVDDPPQPIEAVAIAPDGTQLATGASDGLRIWDIASKRERLWLLRGSHVAALAYAPDGSRVLSGSTDPASPDYTYTTRLWDVTSGRELWQVSHSGGVETVAFSPDGSHVATGGWDLHARVLEARNGWQVAKATHAREVSKVMFSADGRYLAIASADGVVRVVLAHSGRQAGRFAPEEGVRDLALSPDSRLLATAGLSSTVHVWDMETGLEVARVPVEGVPGSVRFGPDDDTLVVSDRVSARTLRLNQATLRHGEALRAATLSPDGRFVAMARREREVLVAPISGGGAAQRVRIAENPNILLLTSDGKTLVTQNEELAVLSVWDTASGRSLWHVARKSGDRRSMRYPEVSRDSRYLTVGYDEAHVLDVASVETGRIVARVVHDGDIRTGSFSPNGDLLVTTGDVTARVWESEGGKLRHRLTLDGDAIDAAFSPDGQRLATCSRDRLVRIWDLADGRELRRFEHAEPVFNVAFSPDSRMLATSTNDGLVHLWQAHTGQEVGRLLHDAPCDFVAFSFDSTYLASGSRDHAARVWDVTTQREVARMTGQGQAFRVAFDAADRYVLVEHMDAGGYLRFWRAWLWRPADLEAETCSRLGRSLSRAEWQRYLGSEAYRPTCPELPVGP